MRGQLLDDVPRQEFADLVDGMIGDAFEDVAKVSFRIELIELCGAEQAVDIGGAFAAIVGAGEQPVLPSKGHRRFILPMSGRKLKFTIAGTRSTGGVCGRSTASNALVGALFTSKPRQAL